MHAKNKEKQNWMTWTWLLNQAFNHTEYKLNQIDKTAKHSKKKCKISEKSVKIRAKFKPNKKSPVFFKDK